MNAIILAAGLGTRLFPLTNNKPKALVEINGVTLLELAIRQLESFGFTEIVINVHAFGDQIIDFIQNNSFNAIIHISDERNELLDTGGGLIKAMRFFTNEMPILVYNVDIISSVNLAELYQLHIQSEAMVSLIVRERKTTRYLLFDTKMNLSGWRNNSTSEEIIVASSPDSLNEYAFSGIHVVDAKIKNYFSSDLHPFSLIPFYLKVAELESIKGVLDNKSSWFDVGKPAQLEEVKVVLSKQSTNDLR